MLGYIRDRQVDKTSICDLHVTKPEEHSRVNLPIRNSSQFAESADLLLPENDIGNSDSRELDVIDEAKDLVIEDNSMT